MEKILYVANVRMPSEKAHGIQIAKTCEAFVEAGREVELIVPERKTIAEDSAAYYGLTHAFQITKLPVPDIVSWGFFGFVIESFFFARAAAKYVRPRVGLIYGRDEIVLTVIRIFTGREFVWESHTGSWNIFARYVAPRAKRVIVITKGLEDFYVAKNVPAQKIVVAHDGVDLASFEKRESKAEARARLGLPAYEKIALYVGAAGMWKGVDTLLSASALTRDARIAVIGKMDAGLSEKYPWVIFVGERPYREIASNLAGADVLVLPTTAKKVVGAHYTSPLKLFAYMASGVPIVASDIPSTREVLPENAAYWFRADDPKSLSDAILHALSDLGAREKAKVAKSEVSLYTWDERAKRILARI
jgi:glycosyltransferase involved in cell wall biosynthesis